MQSKLDFFMGFFGFFLNQLLGIVFLQLVFEKIPHLNGWSFYQLVFIYGFAQIPRGIDHFFTDYLWLFARKTVKEGSFEVCFLLRYLSFFPKNEIAVFSKLDMRCPVFFQCFQCRFRNLVSGLEPPIFSERVKMPSAT